MGAEVSSHAGKKVSQLDVKPKTYLKEAESLAEDALSSVAVCYDAADVDVAHRVVNAIAAEGKRTVYVQWNQTEITPEYMDVVNSCIEAADNFVFLLSPDSLSNEECQWSLDHALKAGKRIVPVECADTSDLVVRPELRALTWVFLTNQAEFAQGARLLARRLDGDLAHTRAHTRLLQRAVLWERFGRAKELLLRGDDKRRAQRWLSETAKGHSPRPVPLVLMFLSQCFIRTQFLADDYSGSDYMANYLSEKGVKHGVASAFISYSRADAGFVNELSDFLTTNGRQVWVDWESPQGEDGGYDEDVLSSTFKAIESCETFIAVLSPSSICEEFAGWELEHALKMGKRIVPVVCRQIDFREARHEIVGMKLTFFTSDAAGGFDAAAAQLVRTLDAELRHLRYHSKILALALDWDANGRKDKFLLKDRDVQNAVDWATAAALGKNPNPTDLHLAYVTASTGRASLWHNLRVTEVTRDQLVRKGIDPAQVDPYLPVYFPEDWLAEAEQAQLLQEEARRTREQEVTLPGVGDDDDDSSDDEEEKRAEEQAAAAKKEQEEEAAAEDATATKTESGPAMLLAPSASEEGIAKSFDIVLYRKDHPYGLLFDVNYPPSFDSPYITGFRCGPASDNGEAGQQGQLQLCGALAGDYIVSINDEVIKTPQQLQQLLRADVLKLSLQRNAHSTQLGRSRLLSVSQPILVRPKKTQGGAET